MDDLMKILVSVKRVVDYNVRVHAKIDGTGVDISDARMSMNPFDEIAVEEAVRLKEQRIAGEVVAVSCGSADCQETLRAALAQGADRGILVETDTGLEPLAVAKVLQRICEREDPQLVICGKQAIDEDANQTGQMLAAMLHWPQATFASNLEIVDGTATITREIDGGTETLEMPLPAVITTDLRLNEPRYATLPNIMKAKRKPLHTVPVTELDVETAPRLTTLKVYPPPARSAGVRVADVAELVDRLRNEAKVI
jgi:electron transfer flavoprotein beta subunit